MRERARSEIHLQRVKPAGVTVDGVNDLSLVDEHIVELHRAGGGAFRRRRHERADFLGLVGIGNIVGAQSAVEESADNDLVRLPGRRDRWIFMDIMRAEAAAAAGIGIDRRQRAGCD